MPSLKAKPAAFPTGPYRYESTEGGVTIDSTVTVRYDAAAAVVDEEVHFGPATAQIESRLDPKTYSATTYVIRDDPDGEEPSIVVSSEGASYKTNGAARVVAKAPVPGAPSWIFGDYASSFVMLPSLIRTTHSQIVNAYTPTVVHGRAYAFKYSVVPSSAARPDGVPAGPTTFVVDGVNIGGATAYLRKP